MTWSFIKHLRTPSTWFSGLHVLSDRATAIPDLPESGVRQIVVRVASRQSTSKKRAPQPPARGSPAAVEPAAPKQQDCEEYFMIQQIRWNGKDSGWQVWGHIKPTDLDTVKSDPHFAPGLSALERLEALQNQGPSGRK